VFVRTDDAKLFFDAQILVFRVLIFFNFLLLFFFCFVFWRLATHKIQNRARALDVSLSLSLCLCARVLTEQKKKRLSFSRACVRVFVSQRLKR